MKRIIAIALLVLPFGLKAQTADEIIAKYFENTGGLAKWKALKGYKMGAKINQQGMEIPIEMVQLKDGRQYTKITFQGKEIMQEVYDGSTLWSHNFMNMKAEKSDAETTDNFKVTIGEFPDIFLNYKERGIKVELVGKETIEGTETFKLKVTKKPIKVDGKETDDVVFYFFDAENFVPLMLESEIKSGQAKGQTRQSKMSDYQEVDGLMFPFSIAQGLKGMGSQTITITSIQLNPEVAPAAFTFPAGN